MKLPTFVAAPALLVLLSAIAVTVPAPAHACSAARDPRHHVRWTPSGFVAFGDPDGRVVVVSGPAAPRVVARDAGFAQVHADVSRDGRTAIRVIEDFSDEALGAGCMATFIAVERIELGARRGRRIARIRAGGSGAVRLSPGGNRALVHWYDYGGIHRVDVLDVAGGRRIRRLEILQAIWLSDERIAAVGEDASVHVIDVTTGTATPVIAAPATTPDADAGPSLLEGDATPDAFSVLVGRGPNGHVARVTLAPAVRVVEAPWVLTDPILTLSPSGNVLVVSSTQPASLRILERRSGRTLATIRGQYGYLDAAFSADGAQLALVSYEAPGPDADDDMYYSPANEPMNLETLDLASGTRIHWGRAARSTLTR